MSHVDEGALHAYLDGALDEYPATEAQRVREHLDSCGSCRERLEVERGIRDQAGSILGLAVPDVAVPTFEELRAYVRANASRPSPVSVRLYRMGWAASVVLALGTGWMLRGEQLPVAPSTSALIEEAPGAPVVTPEVSPPAGPGAQRETAATGARRSNTDAVQTLGANESTVIRTPQEVTRSGSAQVLADAVADARPAAAARLDEVVASGTVVRQEEAARATQEVAQQRTSAPAPEVPADRAASAPAAVTADAAGAGGVAEPERRSAPADAVSSANAAAPAAGFAARGRAVTFGDAADDVAEDQESYSLVVPGLDVIDVRARGDGTRQEGQIYLQRLPSGGTLELVHLPPDVDPASLAEPGPGIRELVVERPAGWLVMRGPLSGEALLELLERMQPER